MNHLEQVEAELRERLAKGDNVDALVTWVKERILESYKNGLSAKGRGQRRWNRAGKPLAKA